VTDRLTEKNNSGSLFSSISSCVSFSLAVSGCRAARRELSLYWPINFTSSITREHLRRRDSCRSTEKAEVLKSLSRETRTPPRSTSLLVESLSWAFSDTPHRTSFQAFRDYLFPTDPFRFLHRSRSSIGG